MSSIEKCALINKIGGITPYIKCYGDEYFQKGWFGYKPIKGPDGKMSTGAMVGSPKFKIKRKHVFVRRGNEFIPGWGSIAGNLTMTDDFELDLANIMGQDNIEGVFWINETTNEVEATYFEPNSED